MDLNHFLFSVFNAVSLNVNALSQERSVVSDCFGAVSLVQLLIPAPKLRVPLQADNGHDQRDGQVLTCRSMGRAAALRVNRGPPRWPSNLTFYTEADN